MEDEKSMEQKCHNLEIKIKRLEDEKNSVLVENEDLQSMLASMSENKINSDLKLVETKKEVIKLTDEFQRLEVVCNQNNEHIQSINDKISDLINIKSVIQQISDESLLLKDELQRMKNRYNVATKLELQTQEQLYESRLLHLESVLEEMKQSECQFLRLAEETNVLKDQVDYLRELSVNAMKSDLPIENHSGHLPLGSSSSANNSPLFPTSPSKVNEYHKALENELKTQFNSLYQSLSNLRAAQSLDKDLIMCNEQLLQKTPEMEETTVRPVAASTPDKTLNDTNCSSSNNNNNNESQCSDNNLLVVRGRFRIANVKKQKDDKKAKSDCFTDAFSKLWVLFFD